MLRGALIGAAAGAVGTVALDVVTYADMLVRARPASGVPGNTAAALAARAGVDLRGEGQGPEDQAKAEQRRSGLGALMGYAVGLGIGTAYGVLRPLARGVPLPLAGVALGLAAMAASDVPQVAVGATDPKDWGASGWAADIIPHLAYGWMTALAYDALGAQVADRPLRRMRAGREGPADHRVAPGAQRGMLPTLVQAGVWGLLAGSALVLGAALAWFTDLPHRAIAAVTGFGAGVLIAVLSVELLVEAQERGGVPATMAGFLGGAVVFSTANWGLARYGARNRKRCGECAQQPAESDQGGSGLAIALGALLDGIPESIVIGLSVLGGGGVSVVAVVGFFLANVPQGLAGAAGMRQAGRSARYVFGVWGGIALLSGAAALVGHAAFGGFAPEVIAATIAVAAGGILAMLAETMVPEAFADAPAFIGLITVCGFLTAFALARVGT